MIYPYYPALNQICDYYVFDKSKFIFVSLYTLNTECSEIK